MFFWKATGKKGVGLDTIGVFGEESSTVCGYIFEARCERMEHHHKPNPAHKK